jgi:hypothetical protein
MQTRFMAPMAVLVVSIAGCGGGSSADCPSLLAEVDALLAKGISMSPEQQKMSKQLRDEAAALQGAGKAKECVAAASKAQEILNKALDAELMNKSDG